MSGNDDLRTPQSLNGVNSLVVSTLQHPYTQEEFNIAYKYHKRKTPTLYQGMKKHYSNCKIVSFIFTLFPILKWLPKYKFKRDLPFDLVSGFTVTILHIPQGMAYASLGAVNPIVGIYMAIFPILVYAMMGTSHHISMGSFSVVCLMAGKPIALYATVPNTTVITKTDLVSPTNKTYNPEEVASVVSFTVGLFQVLLGFCKFGSISRFLSEPLMSGFITGAAILVIVSQLKHVFAVNPPVVLNDFYVPTTIYYIGNEILKTNVIALGMCLAAITILYLYSKFLQPRIKKKYQFLVPSELIVMTVSTVISHYCKLKEKYHVPIVGEIPTGMKTPQPPPVELIKETKMLLHCLIIAIVSFSVNVAMASTLAKKDKYDIDSNQELIASGFGNMFGGFFPCLPIAASLSRSMLQYTSGGKTQLASVFSSILLCSVLLYFGEFLDPLPYSILAGIVIVCLRSTLMQVRDLPKFWKRSTNDGISWLVTFLSVVILDIHIGLIVALLLAILSIVLMNQNLYVCLLGQVPNTDMFLEIDRYPAAKPIPNFVIIQVYGGLNFANIQIVKNKIERWINKIKLEKPFEQFNLVIDMSGVSSTDPSALKVIGTCIEDLHTQGVNVSLARCSVYVYEQMKKCNFFNILTESNLFLTIQDALDFNVKKI